MFKEIVRNYALQQLDASFFVLQNVMPLFPLGGKKRENITAYVKRTRLFLENREYSKMSSKSSD